MATNFLEAAGTNGFIATPQLVAWVTALNGLTNGSTSLSSTVFSSATMGQAIKAHAWMGGSSASFTPSAGGNLTFWWLMSTDGGTTFETVIATPSSTVPALPRSPDFTIPFDNAAFTSGSIRFAQGPFKYPYVGAKLLLQNNTGATLPTGPPTITLGGVADQY